MELLALVSGSGSSYILNSNGNAIRTTLKGYKTCPPEDILQQYIDKLTKKQRLEIFGLCDETKDVIN